MNKNWVSLLALALWAGALFGQAKPDSPNPPKKMRQVTVRSTSPPSSVAPTLLNLVTIIGAQTTVVPCQDCVPGADGPTLGLPAPLASVQQGGTYDVAAYLVDNRFTGPCTFTMTVQDVNKTIVASSTESFPEAAVSDILVKGTVTIPATAALGLGTVTTTAVCGSHTVKSQGPVFLSCTMNPPHCK